MALRPEYTLHQSEFGSFLYAPVRDDEEAQLSVLSVMARLDIDPWAEAARLAALPTDAAAASLAETLSRLPLDLRGSLDLATIANRLIGLLPPVGPATPSNGSGHAAPGDVRFWILLSLLAAAVLVAFLSGLGRGSG